jgi:dihydroorotate dehydrogenase (NAD+) catalytic subunit
MLEQTVQIVSNARETGLYFRLVVRAPEIAAATQPGQFAHIRIVPLKEALLRRPFSIFQVAEDTFSILYKIVGQGTEALSRLEPRAPLSVIGPLGHGFTVPRAGGETPLLVAGGYGMAALYLLAQRSPQKGLVCVGGRRAADILCEAEFRALGWDVRVATEDGSRGERGLVTQPLEAELRRGGAGRKLFACGPTPMLQAVARLAEQYAAPAEVSLDEHMCCGLGVCLACVVPIKTAAGWEYQRSCTEGPVFEAEKVAWGLADARPASRSEQGCGAASECPPVPRRGKRITNNETKMGSADGAAGEKAGRGAVAGGPVNLAVQIGRLKLRNPVLVASGTFGYGVEYARLFDLNQLGAVVVKGIRLQPVLGNPTPRTVEVTSGLLNAIGLQGPGVDGFLSKYWPFLRELRVPTIINIWGTTISEYGEVARRFDAVEGVGALELNVSCPNIKEGGAHFGTDVRLLGQVVAACRKATTLPLITKLSPNVPHIGPYAVAAAEAGSDALAITNSFPAMAIDAETRRPKLANVSGGLTGPCIKPMALKLVYDAARAVRLPIVGMGGIQDATDAVEFLLAGATAIAVGTANFYEPQTALDVIAGLREYLERHRLGDVRELVGAATPNRDETVTK